MSIHHGDQYSLPLNIKKGTNALTPSDVDDLRIQVGDVMKSYAESEIVYDSQRQLWLFPMTEEMTRELSTWATSVQVGVKVGSDIIYSDVMQVDVLNSIISEEWDDE